MSPNDIDIADMQCWAFRIAQTRWGLSPQDCANLFASHNLLGFIRECYDALHTSGYESVVDELEAILQARGALAC